MVWQAIRSHADSIASSLPVITSMLDVIDSKQNLTVPQAVALFATALDFKPDVILELGRGAGNSTAVFAQAASLFSGSKVHSMLGSLSMRPLARCDFREDMASEDSCRRPLCGRVRPGEAVCLLPLGPVPSSFTHTLSKVDLLLAKYCRKP